MSQVFRYYQKEADDAIFNELLISDRCLVKIFCGLGKSLLMRKCRVTQDKSLVVYTFPSLSLIDQFTSDYFDQSHRIFKISSEAGSTTDSIEIRRFLLGSANAIKLRYNFNIITHSSSISSNI